jgi:hypothetical protein
VGHIILILDRYVFSTEGHEGVVKEIWLPNEIVGYIYCEEVRVSLYPKYLREWKTRFGVVTINPESSTIIVIIIALLACYKMLLDIVDATKYFIEHRRAVIPI